MKKLIDAMLALAGIALALWAMFWFWRHVMPWAMVIVFAAVLLCVWKIRDRIVSVRLTLPRRR